MFSQNSQTPDDDQYKTLQNNSRRRRIRSFKNKNKRKAQKKQALQRKAFIQPTFSRITMSSWAENFTHAATWQLKHQIAFWKSKATALEYENRILHDIIRQNYVGNSPSDRNEVNESNTENITENLQESENSDEEDRNSEDFEVSEEYIQFLMNNKKYKDDARQERERLRAKENTEEQLIEQMEAIPTRSPDDQKKMLKDLYGERWQKISALEISLKSEFMNRCDCDKPEYWPNIPLNFNFS